MKRLFQSNGNGAHRKSAIDSDLLRILVPPVICVVICCTFFVGASWAWFTDSATCGVEDIKAESSWGEQVNVTVTEIPAVSPMLLAAEVESTEAEEETEQPTEWTLDPEPTPTEDPTPTAAPTTEPAPETSVSPEPTPTEEPTAAPTTENAEGQEQSVEQASALASQG